MQADYLNPCRYTFVSELMDAEHLEKAARCMCGEFANNYVIDSRRFMLQ